MTNSYMVKWDGGQMMFSGLDAAKKKAVEKNGKIFIADGKYTESIDGIDIHHIDNDGNKNSSD